MDERTNQLRTISNRLVLSLGLMVPIAIIGSFCGYKLHVPFVTTPMAILVVGSIGGFIGIQRRLKLLPPEDLNLMANSWVCMLLSPIAGAVLAEVLYVLFISGLLTGPLFPTILPDDVTQQDQSFRSIFHVHCTAQDYAKIMFWSFLAGFSEKFVTNIMGTFESRADDKPQPPTADPPPLTSPTL